MKKGIIITGIVLLTLVAGYWAYTRYAPLPCPPERNPKRFPEPWRENKIPHGDLARIAEQYANPILGDDTQTNGALVGGFFKGIDVYPSAAAAKYYRTYLKRHLSSDRALPYWNIQIRELLCLKNN